VVGVTAVGEVCTITTKAIGVASGEGGEMVWVGKAVAGSQADNKTTSRDKTLREKDFILNLRMSSQLIFEE
jgi:hypothetical protein